ncbi:Detected protein of unknown function [Hibiscus syriacus]|uniref:Uncharacterized protein n=1 Tax=Hibiscus syriacus TaxID=106335 RepID=A0A6A2YXX9_HIBSY|nr:uncharacterized protein LOC120155287 [Hibiscus syriacus]KAE8683845.1 Detected protein of unknown function [Hibiscus syriacus]
MGNCMKKTFRSRQQVEEEEIEEIREAATKENEGGKGSMKVKIVLTKEELELLLVKLKNKNGNNGGYRLGELLAEMEKARSVKVECCWRPSLESIMEDEEDDVISS